MIAFLSVVVGFIVAIGAYFYYDTHVAEVSNTETERTETITQPPIEIPALTTINRSGQNLTEMPKDILSMTQVQELNLSNNRLTGALPAEIRHLQNLVILNISDNNMTGLPAEIGQLSKLQILNASNNQLTGIPHELGNLQNLELLDLSGNDISEYDLDSIRERLPASVEIRL